MAEGFFRKHCKEDYEPMSAGTRHKSQINPVAVEVMKEVGVDISGQKPKELTEDMMRNAAKIINMGCMDKDFCPALFAPKVVYGLVNRGAKRKTNIQGEGDKKRD